MNNYAFTQLKGSGHSHSLDLSSSTKAETGSIQMVKKNQPSVKTQNISKLVVPTSKNIVMK